MKCLRLVCLAVATVSAYGCVLSTEPLGSVSEELDVTDWEGMWIHEPAFSDEPIVAVSGNAVEWSDFRHVHTVQEHPLATHGVVYDDDMVPRIDQVGER